MPQRPATVSINKAIRFRSAFLSTLVDPIVILSDRTPAWPKDASPLGQRGTSGGFWVAFTHPGAPRPLSLHATPPEEGIFTGVQSQCLISDSKAATSVTGFQGSLCLWSSACHSSIPLL